MSQQIKTKHDHPAKEGHVRVVEHIVKTGFGEEDGEYTQTVLSTADEDTFVEKSEPIDGNEQKKRVQGGGRLAVWKTVETAIDTESGVEWVPFDDLRLEAN